MTHKLDNLPTGVDKHLVARVLDCCQIASERQVVKHTDFLDPYHRDFVRPLVGNFFGIRSLEDGGYAGAEKKRLIVFPDYYRPDDIDLPIAVMEISLSDSAKVLSHRDYLGAIVGLGLRRSVVGDIIAYVGGAQVVAAREIVPALQGLGEVNRYKASVVEIPPYQIRVEEQPQRTINSTVATVRLDAVLSSGLGIGRGKAVELIKSDKVKVNWRSIGQPGFQLSAGDVLSIRGKGRLELTEVGAETKKGRTRITLRKFS